MAPPRYYPNDPRWHGPQRHYFNVSNIRAIILIAYVILIIVEGALLRNWLSGRISSTSDPYSFWARTGVYLIIDAAASLTMAWLIHAGKWHPITALVTSILLFGLWFAGCFINALVVYSNEYYFEKMDAWSRIGYAEAALQGLIAACYLVMIGFAAVAVHIGRKNGWGKRSAEQRVDALVMEPGASGARGATSTGEGELAQGKVGSTV